MDHLLLYQQIELNTLFVIIFLKISYLIFFLLIFIENHTIISANSFEIELNIKKYKFS